VKGKILEVNSELRESPEWINLDCYGRGWVAVIEPENLERKPGTLFDAESYVDVARRQAEAELKS